nr:zinc knuckle CX2CX4HX4C [Tanacetum cinerariifolium]
MSNSTNGGQFVGLSVKQNVRYEPKANTSAPKKGVTNVGNTSQSSFMLKATGKSSKKDNISMSNSFSALNDEEDDDEEDVENVYDESTNIIQVEVYISRLLLVEKLICLETSKSQVEKTVETALEFMATPSGLHGDGVKIYCDGVRFVVVLKKP